MVDVDEQDDLIKRLRNADADRYRAGEEQPVDETTTGDVTASDVTDSAEQTVGKTLNGAQTQSLITVIGQYAAGTLTLGQAVNIVAVAIGVSKEEAQALIEGAI